MNNKDFKIYATPDKTLKKELDEAIKINDGYCCCATTKNEDTKCPCKEFRESTAVDFCHCGRFFKLYNLQEVTWITNLVDKEESNILSIIRLFNKMGLIFHTIEIPEKESYEFIKYLNLYKTIIGKSSLVVLDDDLYANEENEEYIKILLEWADELNIPTVNFNAIFKGGTI